MLPARSFVFDFCRKVEPALVIAKGVLRPQLVQHIGYAEQAETMTKRILLGCGDFSIHDLYRLRGVADGYVQPIVIKDAAKDLPVAVQAAAGLNRIVQKIRQHHHKGVRWDRQPGQVIDPDLHLDFILPGGLVLLIENDINDRVVGADTHYMNGSVLLQAVEVIPGCIHLAPIQQVPENPNVVFKFVGAPALHPVVLFQRRHALLLHFHVLPQEQ